MKRRGVQLTFDIPRQTNLNSILSNTIFQTVGKTFSPLHTKHPPDEEQQLYVLNQRNTILSEKGFMTGVTTTYNYNSLTQK